MDTRTVVKLSGKAIEGVLVFRVSAFKSKAFLDIKNVKTAASSTIRALCKERGYSGEVPLVNVVEIVGNAVSSAADKWNKIADPKNHIDRDWLRHCVCDLVGGAVTHAAFEENEWLRSEVVEEEEYLDPVGDDCEDIGDDSIDTVIRKPAAVPVNDDHAYYNLQQSQFDTEHDTLEDALLPHHQISQHWAELKDAEAGPSTWATPDEPTSVAASLKPNTTLSNVSHKRPASESGSDDNDDGEPQLLQPKRRCNVGQASTTPVPNAVLVSNEEEDNDEEVAAIEAPKQRRKVSTKAVWNLEESNRLVALRDSGKSWDEVLLSFRDRSKAAIMNKYRLLTSRDTAEGEEEGSGSVPKDNK